MAGKVTTLGKDVNDAKDIITQTRAIKYCQQNARLLVKKAKVAVGQITRHPELQEVYSKLRHYSPKGQIAMSHHQLAQRKSSEILLNLLGETSKYTRIMQAETRKLKKKYSNKNLQKIFDTLPNKIITICPMLLCDELTKDLGGKCNEKILAAVGLICFTLSTHDDVVDETPRQRSQLAALTYAGNLTTLESIQILEKYRNQKLTTTLIQTVCENHLKQQFRVDLLWEKKPKNVNDYLKGIEDLNSLAAIGPLIALEITRKPNLKQKIRQFAEGYGKALQIIDDIREIEEDIQAGYTSFPAIEGKPFKKSFGQLKKHLRIAQQALNPKWRRMLAIVKKAQSFTRNLQDEFN